jgi:hypothetical protein
MVEIYISVDVKQCADNNLCHVVSCHNVPRTECNNTLIWPCKNKDLLLFEYSSQQNHLCSAISICILSP